MEGVKNSCALHPLQPICKFTGSKYLYTVSEEDSSQAKMACVRALNQSKENEYPYSQEEEEMQPDEAQQGAAARIGHEQDNAKALYTVSGSSHSVWTPRSPVDKQPVYTDVFLDVVRSRRNLSDRRASLETRILATNLVLKMQKEDVEQEAAEQGGEQEGETHPPAKTRWQKTLMEDKQQRSHQFHDIVSQYAEKMATTSQDDQSVTFKAKAEADNAIKLWRSKSLCSRKRTSLFSSDKTVCL